jgi:transcriptional regulator with XRE-family HTH domain
MKVGDKLRLLRKLKGMTQEEIAEKLHLSRRAYANLESNITKIDLPRIKQIAEVYGLETEELLNFNETQAFTNCFNNNINGFFSAEKIYSGSTKEERDFFVRQMQLLITSFNDERKMFMEVISNLNQFIQSKQ